jgi:NAD(P)-dependent dehydrogenase (short-subunit alcohol dehydrogenase family)
MPATASPVWFVTGCSSGFGYELARLVIARGWPVVVTARDRSRLAAMVEGHDATTLALDLDVTDQRQIDDAVSAAEARFGRIDVLVNNAGYGYMASVEEGVEEEIRRQFDANVFGLFAMTRRVLPVMRRQRRGHVINITSLAGLIGLPASGYYAASKHAVEGWSDSLAAEGRPIGIRVTCIEPGPFRTDWAGRSVSQTENRIPDYAETAGARLANAKRGSGRQPGDPVRAMEAVIAIAQLDDPPRHLVLGAFGMETATRTLAGRLEEIRKWEALGLSTDYPGS